MTWLTRLVVSVLAAGLTAWLQIAPRRGPGGLEALGLLADRLAVAAFLASVFSLAYRGTITLRTVATDMRDRPRFWCVAALVFVAYLGSGFLPESMRRWPPAWSP